MCGPARPERSVTPRPHTAGATRPLRPPRSNIIGRRWGRGWRPAFVYQHTVTNDGSLRSYAVASLVVWREANRKQTHRAVSVSAGVCVCVCVEEGVNPEVAKQCHANKSSFECER